MYQIIRPEDAEGTARMDVFVRRHRCGHFLQSPSWAQVKHLWKWRGVLAWEEGEIAGAVSVLIRHLPLGLSILYAPRGPVCQRSDPAVMEALLSGVREIAKAENAILLYIDPDEPDSNAPFRGLMESLGFAEQTSEGFDNIQAQYVYRLDLAGRTEDAVFGGFSAKARYNIRLARRRGVQIRAYPGGSTVPDEALAAFSRLMQTTGTRDHFCPRDEGYFRRVMDAMKDMAVLYLAYLEDEPIGGTIALFYGGKSWYLYGASANCHRNAMPNYLLQWEMIREAIRRGCGMYDLRGVPGDLRESNPLYGLYRFKKSFGGDYTKFSGLFIYKYKPMLAELFLFAYRRYRKMGRFFHTFLL